MSVTSSRVVALLTRVTGTGPGDWIANNADTVRSIQAKAVGTGADLNVSIQGSFDQIAIVGLGTLHPIEATDDGITIQCAYDWIRANVTTATSGAVTVVVGG